MERVRNFYEISEAPSPDGRRRVKVSLHEIYPDDSQYNSNGITYLEKYVEANGNSIIGMPLCAAFLDEDKEIPYDHGMTGSDDGMPLFENSVQVGSCDAWSIEDIVIEGVTHRVCMAAGYINQQRYPSFVKWLENRLELNLVVPGSVEFVRTKENSEIIYDGGWKEKGRIPMVYDYSGYCFLTVKPSDNAAMLVELNSEQEQEGETKMTIEELCSKLEAFMQRYDEENACKKELEQNAAKVVELNATIEQLNAALEASRKELEGKYQEISTLYEEQELLRKEMAKAKLESRIGELNSALADYTDEQKDYAKDEIEAYKVENSTVEINSITMKIDAAIYRKLKEANAVELNAQKASFDVDDIFAPVDPVDVKEEVTDFSDMLG